jgi:hypothetical protein
MVKGFFLAMGLSWGAVGVADLDTDLIGGRVVSRRDFPELIRIRQEGATCSASIIGPRVVLTAAHCSTADGAIVPVSESVDYSFEVLGGTRFTARCTLAPGYAQDDHDMALCLSNAELPPPYASVGAEVPMVGAIVTLTGYGCTQPGGGGGNNGTLKIGDARVTSIPAGRPHGYWFETTAGAGGDAAICFGDSGGPVYRQLHNRREPHVVIGVNSRGDIRRVSLLTALGLRVSKDFIDEYARLRGLKICGVNEDCGGKKPH